MWAFSTFKNVVLDYVQKLGFIKTPCRFDIAEGYGTLISSTICGRFSGHVSEYTKSKGNWKVS